MTTDSQAVCYFHAEVFKEMCTTFQLSLTLDAKSLNGGAKTEVAWLIIGEELCTSGVFLYIVIKLVDV